MNTKSYRILPTLTSVGLLAAIAVQAQAQLVTYQFTGTKIEGTAGIGDTIVGSLTLDIGAAPDYVEPEPSGGEFARWSGGNFSIDGMTNTGFTEGTSVGGRTSFQAYDFPSYPLQGTYIESLQSDETHGSGIQLYSYSYSAGDGIASVPNPWNPFADDAQFVYIWHDDYATNAFEAGEFRLETFIAMPTSIIIDGCDTGVPDFTYEGQLVSEHLADCAAGATNHGAFVCSVAALTKELKKAGLLTGKQGWVLVACAVASSIGK